MAVSGKSYNTGTFSMGNKMKKILNGDMASSRLETQAKHSTSYKQSEGNVGENLPVLTLIPSTNHSA